MDAGGVMSMSSLEVRRERRDATKMDLDAEGMEERGFQRECFVCSSGGRGVGDAEMVGAMPGHEAVA